MSVLCKMDYPVEYTFLEGERCKNKTIFNEYRYMIFTLTTNKSNHKYVFKIIFLS